jgi:hypothetical protein
MSAWIATLNRVWTRLSTPLKVVTVVVTLVVACVIAATVTILAWNAGIIQDKLGVLPTKDDLQEQTESLATAQTQKIDSVVNDAIDSYDLLMRQYMAEERRLAIDTAYVPLLRHIKTLTDAVTQLQRSSNATDSRVRELPRQFDEQLTRMIEAVDPASDKERMEEIMRQNAELQERLDELGKQIKDGRRTSKMKL